LKTDTTVPNSQDSREKAEKLQAVVAKGT